MQSASIEVESFRFFNFEALFAWSSPNRTKLEPLGRGDEGFVCNYLIGSSPVWGPIRWPFQNIFSPQN
jgi:hypothetical protein